VKKLLLLSGLIFATSSVLSELSPCEGESKEWSNCFGTESYDSGEYKGEYLSGKSHGQGTYLWEGFLVFVQVELFFILIVTALESMKKDFYNHFLNFEIV